MTILSSKYIGRRVWSGPKHGNSPCGTTKVRGHDDFSVTRLKD